MDRSFLILHGIDNQRPPQHWQFLLAADLARAGEDVRYPAMPDAEAPRLPVWEAVLRRMLEETAGTDRTIVCHSLACLLWLRVASAISRDERPSRLLLVAPPASELIPESAAGFRIDRVDAGAVLGSVKDEITIVCCEEDPLNPGRGACERYGDPLGIVPVEIVGARHFTPETGYGSWPSVFEWCMQPGTPIVGAPSSSLAAAAGA